MISVLSALIVLLAAVTLVHMNTPWYVTVPAITGLSIFAWYAEAE